VRLLTLLAGREHRLEKALLPVRDSYDVMVIDCPPALNILTVNALTAADSVPGADAVRVLRARGAFRPHEHDRADPRLGESEARDRGILRTMFDPRNNLSNDVAAQLIEHFGDRVFRTIIPRNVRLAEAPSFGVPAMLHDRDSRGALAYLALAGELFAATRSRGVPGRAGSRAGARNVSEPEIRGQRARTSELDAADGRASRRRIPTSRT
jgi:chromosome partitioning protein